MEYRVVVPKKVLKGLGKLPLGIRQRFDLLADVLRNAGPTGPHKWQNYSKLGENKYHCHLNYRYVACWYLERESITIEVYYAGSREDAPY